MSVRSGEEEEEGGDVASGSAPHSVSMARLEADVVVGLEELRRDQPLVVHSLLLPEHLADPVRLGRRILLKPQPRSPVAAEEGEKEPPQPRLQLLKVVEVCEHERVGWQPDTPPRLSPRLPARVHVGGELGGAGEGVLVTMARDEVAVGKEDQTLSEVQLELRRSHHSVPYEEVEGGDAGAGDPVLVVDLYRSRLHGDEEYSVPARPSVEVHQNMHLLSVDLLRRLQLVGVPDVAEGGACPADRLPPGVLQPGALVGVEGIAEGNDMLPAVCSDEEQHLPPDGRAGEVRCDVSYPQRSCRAAAGDGDVQELSRQHGLSLQVGLLSELQARRDERRTVAEQRALRKHRMRGEDRTGQDRTRQDKTGQDKTGQDRTRQDRTGQERREEKRGGEEKSLVERRGEERRGEEKRGEERRGEARAWRRKGEGEGHRIEERREGKWRLESINNLLANSKSCCRREGIKSRLDGSENDLLSSCSLPDSVMC
eukprot:768780-Hanusia_phi.AAC.1